MKRYKFAAIEMVPGGQPGSSVLSNIACSQRPGVESSLVPALASALHWLFVEDAPAVLIDFLCCLSVVRAPSPTRSTALTAPVYAQCLPMSDQCIPNSMQIGILLVLNGDEHCIIPLARGGGLR